MDNTTLIILQSLELNFTSIVDICTIFKKCTNNALSENHFKKTKVDNKTIVKNYLFILLNKNYINRIDTSEYKINEKGLLYVNELKSQVDNITNNYYLNIIKSTVKEIDQLMAEILRNQNIENSNPTKIKYYQSTTQLNDNLQKVLNCYHIHSINEDNILLISTWKQIIIVPGSVLDQHDIIVDLLGPIQDL